MAGLGRSALPQHVLAHHPGAGRVLSELPQGNTVPMVLSNVFAPSFTQSDVGGGGVYTRTVGLWMEGWFQDCVGREFSYASGNYTCAPKAPAATLSASPDTVAASGGTSGYDRALYGRTVTFGLTLTYTGRDDAASGVVYVCNVDNFAITSLGGIANRDLLVTQVMNHPFTKAYGLSYFKQPRHFSGYVLDANAREEWNPMRNVPTYVNVAVPEYAYPGNQAFGNLVVLVVGWDSSLDGTNPLRVQMYKKVEVRPEYSSLLAAAATASPAQPEGLVKSTLKTLANFAANPEVIAAGKWFGKELLDRAAARGPPALLP